MTGWRWFIAAAALGLLVAACSPGVPDGGQGGGEGGGSGGGVGHSDAGPDSGLDAGSDSGTGGTDGGLADAGDAGDDGGQGDAGGGVGGSGGSGGGTGGGSSTLLSIVIDTPALGTVTANPTQTVTGHLTGGVAPWAVTVNGQPATVTADTFSNSITLPAGLSTITATVTDSSGATATDSRSIDVDTSAPAITITTPATNPAAATSALMMLAGTVGDRNLAWVHVQGQPVTVVAGAFVTQVPVTVGQTSVLVEAVDTVGNRSTYTQVFEASALPPVITVLSPVDGYDSQTPTVVVRVRVTSAQALASVRIGTGAAQLAGTDFQAEVPLALGQNVIPIEATDVFGLSSATRILVTFRDTGTEALQVTGVDPPTDSLDVEPDSLISLAFNKAIDGTALASHIIVRTGGVALAGSFFIVPGGQQLGFSASDALPEGAVIQVEVAGLNAQNGPGLARPWRSAFTVRRPLTVLRGVVLDDTVTPVANALVEVEGLGLSARTASNGNFTLVLPTGGTRTLRIAGVTTVDGLPLPTLRRRVFADNEATTSLSPTFLVPIDDTTARPVTGAAETVTFADGVALSWPAAGFAFSTGQVSGTVTLTEVPAHFISVPNSTRGGPEYAWQLQPAGTRLQSPATVSVPNTTHAPPGRHALFYGYDAALHQLVRAGIGRVTVDGASVSTLPPFAPSSLEWFGVRVLNEAEDAEVVRTGIAAQLPGFTIDGGTGLRERRMPSQPTLADLLLNLLLPKAMAQVGGVAFPFDQLFGSLDTIATSYLPASVNGVVHPPALDVTLTVDSPRPGAGLTLSSTNNAWRLPIVAKAEGSLAGEPVLLALTAIHANPTQGAFSPPAGEHWTQTSTTGTASLNTFVEFTTDTPTLVVQATQGGTSHTIQYVVTTEARDAGSTDGGVDGGMPPPTFRIMKTVDTTADTVPAGVGFAGLPVQVTADYSQRATTGSTGHYSIPVPTFGLSTAIACTTLPAGYKAVPRLGANGQQTYTRVLDTYETCSMPITVAPAITSTADILVDARWLNGALRFVDTQGNLLASECSLADGGTDGGEPTSLTPDDIAATEVHFFREDDVKQPIAQFAVAHFDTNSCGDTASGFYSRLRVGPRSYGKLATRQRCRDIRARLGTDAGVTDVDARYFEDTCKPGAPDLKPGETLVVFAFNHRTGHSGLTRVVVPPVTQHLGTGTPCALDTPGQPLPTVSVGGANVPMSRCVQADLAVTANLTMYPPELRVQVDRRMAVLGVKAGLSDAMSVRTGGFATTTDGHLGIATHWRVRTDLPDGGLSLPIRARLSDGGLVDVVAKDTASPPPPQCLGTDGGWDGGWRTADGGFPVASCAGGLIDWYNRGQPLEVPCADVAHGAPTVFGDICLRRDGVVVDVPAGVPAIYGKVSRATNSAISTPGNSVFPIRPGASVVMAEVAERLGTTAGVQTLQNLPKANYYVHAVGYPVGGRTPAAAIFDSAHPSPPPDFGAVDGALPANALRLKAVYRSVEPGTVRAQRFDWTKEFEVRVAELFDAGAVAITADGGSYASLDGGARSLTTATASAQTGDLAYQYFTTLMQPADVPRATTMPTNFVVRLGSDSTGLECPVSWDSTRNTLSATCDGNAIQDVVTPLDVAYLELYLTGNADNILSRITFYGLGRRVDHVASGSDYTRAASTAPELENSAARPVSTVGTATFVVSPVDVTSTKTAFASVCSTPSCSSTLPDGGTSAQPNQLVTRVRLANVAGQLMVAEVLEGAPVVADVEAQADGTQRFHVALPNPLANVEDSSGSSTPALAVYSYLEIPADTFALSQKLGTPKGRFEAENVDAWAQQMVGPVNLANGNLSFTHVDFSVPNGTQPFTFARTYNNQDNSIGGLGLGWTHSFEGLLTEEETINFADAGVLRRYSAKLGGQAYAFKDCDWDTLTTAQKPCLATDGTHGGALVRAVDSSTTPEKQAFVFTAGTGEAFLFRTPKPAVLKQVLPDAGVYQLRKQWLLSASEDGHGVAMGNVVTDAIPDNWTTYTYETDSAGKPTVRLSEVARVNAGPLKLAFTWEAFGADGGTLPPAAVLTEARNTGLQRLAKVELRDDATTLYRVEFAHSTGHTLAEALTTTPDFDTTLGTQWRYSYATSQGEGIVALETSNEVTTAARYDVVQEGDAGKPVTQALAESVGVRQWYAEFGRDGGVFPPAHVSVEEVVTSFRLPGQSGAMTRLEYLTPSTRKVTWPTTQTTDVTLTGYGAVKTSSTGSRRLSGDWTSQLDAGVVVPSDYFSDSTRVKSKPEYDARLRPADTLVEGRYDGGTLSGQPSTVDTVDSRFGVPTSTSLNRQHDAVTLSAPVNVHGDVTSVMASSATGPLTLFSAPTFDAQGRLTQWTDESGRLVAVQAFDARWGTPSKLEYTLASASTGGLGSFIRHLRYDTLGRLVETRDEAGGAVLASHVSTYDALGRLVSSVSGPGTAASPEAHVSWAYVLSPDTVATTESCLETGRRVTSVVTDGLLVSRAEATGTGTSAEDAVTTFTWDGGRLASSVDALRVKRAYTYSLNEGFLLQVSATGDAGALLEKALAVDSEGRPLLSVDSVGAALSASYDALGRAVGTDAGAGSVSLSALDVTGASFSVADGTRSFSTQLDALGRTAAVTADGGLTVATAHDAAGRLIRRLDDYGVTETRAYNDVLGRLTFRRLEVPVAGGLETLEDSFSYSLVASGVVRTVVTRTLVTPTTPDFPVVQASRTQVLASEVDSRGLLLASEETIEGAVQRSTFAYDAEGRLLSRTLPGNLTSRFEYDVAGRLLASHDEEDAGAQRQYDAVGHLVDVFGPHPEAHLHFDYDALGRVTHKTTQRGGANAGLDEVFLSYGDGGVTVTDAEGYVTSTTLNGVGQVLQSSVGYDKADVSKNRVVTRTYDGSKVALEETHEGGWYSRRALSWDSHGRVVSDVDAWQGDAAGDDAFEYVTTHRWAPVSGGGVEDSVVVASVVTSGGRRPSLSPYRRLARYDGLGRLSLSRDGTVNPVSSVWLYDAAGQLVASSSEGALPTVFTLHEGRLASATQALGPSLSEETLSSWTPRGQLASLTTPDGRMLTRGYSRTGLVSDESFGFAQGPRTSTHFDYDAAGQLSARTEAFGTPDEATTRFDSGPRGELRSVTLPVSAGVSAKYSYGFDSAGRLTDVTPPGPVVPSQHLEYDGLGRPTRRALGSRVWVTSWSEGVGTTTAPGGDVLASLVDSHGRVSRRRGLAGVSSASVPGIDMARFAYDGLEALRLVGESRTGVPDVVQAFDYDDAHRLLGVSRTGAPAVAYEYNSPGLPALPSARRVGSAAVSFAYDGFGRVSSVAGAWGSTAVTWEAGGQRLACLSDSLVTEGFSYESRGWVSGIASSCAPSAPPSRVYSYDARGNRKSESAGGVTRQFQYDNADRLTLAAEWDGTVQGWGLNLDGTRVRESTWAAGTSVPMTGPPPSAPASVREYSYLDGLVSAVTDVGSHAQVAHYGSDVLGRVTSVAEGGITSTLTWDVDTRLVRRDTAGVVTAYGYDALGVRRSATSAGVTRSWVYGGSNGEDDIAEDGNPTARVGGFVVAQGDVRIGHDALGSAVRQVSASTAASTSTEWSAWGTAVSSGPALTTHGYAGLHEETPGMKVAGQRWLLSNLGQFASIDSIGPTAFLASPISLNPWAYAAGGPTRYVDRDGRVLGDGSPGYDAMASCGGGALCSPEQQQGRARALEAAQTALYAAAVGALHSAARWMTDNAADFFHEQLSLPTMAQGQYQETEITRPGAAVLAAPLAAVAQMPEGVASLPMLPALPILAPRIASRMVGDFERAQDFDDTLEASAPFIELGSGAVLGGVSLWRTAATSTSARAFALRIALEEAPLEQDFQARTLAWLSDSRPEIATKGSLFSVDPSMIAKDIEAGLLLEDGYITNPSRKHLQSLVTESGKLQDKRLSGQFMYAIDIDDNIFIGTRAGKRMPHPTLIGGWSPRVKAAGIVDVRGGRIYSVDNSSGHFKPDARTLKAAEEVFRQLPETAFRHDFKGFRDVSRRHPPPTAAP